jgi:hypothetical protein
MSETLYISHGANPNDWFIVEPREGKTEQSIVNTPIDQKMAVEGLLRAGRTVYRIEAVPFLGKPFWPRWRLLRAHRRAHRRVKV